jgi:hypothetical protein
MPPPLLLPPLLLLLLLLLLQDLVGNTRANLQLIFNKLVDDQHLPDVAADATKVRGQALIM